jgi:hypothetical protein
MAAAQDRAIMSWCCIIIAQGERRDVGAVAFVAALRKAWRDAGAPADAAAFVNRGSASRFTFLLPPEVVATAGDLLGRYDATRCTQAPNLRRYVPLRL